MRITNVEESAVGDPTTMRLEIRALEALCDSNAAAAPAVVTEFLRRLRSVFAAETCVLWRAEDRSFTLVAGEGVPPAWLDASTSVYETHAELLQRALARRDSQILVPPAEAPLERAANGTPRRHYFAPVFINGNADALLEVLPGDAATAADRERLVLLVHLVRKLEHFLARDRERTVSRRAWEWEQQQQFIDHVYASLDGTQTAYAIANEAKRLIGCDRVSVAIRRGATCRVEAVSGQDVLDKRSNVVTLLGQVATRVAATRESLWFFGDNDDLPRQVKETLHAYIEESFVKTIAVVPLEDRRADHSDDDDADAIRGPRELRVIGAVIVEQIEEILPRENIEQQVDFVRRHAERGLANALSHSNLFLMPLWRRLGALAGSLRGRALSKTLAAAAVVLCVVLALCLVPADFELEARGTLQPTEKSDVFAPVKGVVRKLHVNSGDPVESGQLLVELDNPDLDARLAATQGEWQAARSQLRSVTSRRLRADDLTDAERLQLAGEIDRLQKLTAVLSEQVQLLEQQHQNLKVFSPRDGQVVTWNLDQLLSGRPVAEGQRLLTIAKPDGPWELELYMPDKRMGHLEDARARLDEGQRLQVTYVLASQAGVTRRGWVKQMQPIAELHNTEGQSVRIRVAVDEGDSSPKLDNPRAGAEVIGNVYCGRRPIGYVWFHEGYEAVQRFLFSNF